ncbi:hypothetical protein DUNSADRAFT_4252 [Dunaliella salina]|uniref:Ribosomal protein L2 C-terminal domain-containing protein n=1 Tax=Dunaliella salina TaxID=3046 RepID=A0ABQ7GSC8_DUNSA|nr:hypothetical protein DUNSADRAFT_4252 [Dunaliella salina]|eukprot:KAF5837505.1 hypothetical protein DUNSADRAFT_4252 [Dunaliella salina]
MWSAARRLGHAWLSPLASHVAKSQEPCAASVLDRAAGPTGRTLLDSFFGHVAGTTGNDASNLFISRSKYTYAFKRSAGIPGLIFWKPYTPGQRHKISLDYKALGVYDGPPKPELSMRVPNTGGRNNTGRVTVRGRGGGMKKILRQVDFSRDTTSEGGIVERIEADPNRSGFLALVRYESPDGLAPAHYKYHLAPDGLKVGDVLRAGGDAPIQAGSTFKLKDIPMGVHIHNIELVPGQGGVMARAAGTSAIIQFKEQDAIVVRLPSSEIRRLDPNCHATVGVVSNLLRKLTNAGKAGTNRHRGRRPKGADLLLHTRQAVSLALSKTRIKFQNAKKVRAAEERERKAKTGAKTKSATPAGPPEHLLGPALPDWAQKVMRDSGKGKQAAASG